MEPISTTIAVVQGVRLALSGVKETAKLAKETFSELENMVRSGASLMDAMPSISSFFSHSAKYEQKKNDLVEAQAKQEALVEEQGEKPSNYISDAEYVLELMAIERQQKQFYEDIKNWLIYSFSEPGLWDDFSKRLYKLQKEREDKQAAKRQAEIDKRLHDASVKMKERRKRQKIYDEIQVWMTSFIIVALLAGFAYTVWWMFQQGGSYA